MANESGKIELPIHKWDDDKTALNAQDVKDALRRAALDRNFIHRILKAHADQKETVAVNTKRNGGCCD